MPAAAILTAASKANLSGGAFADTLTVNSGDSLTVPTFGGQGRIVALWGSDSDSVAEFEIYSTRTEGFHDTVNGFRWQCPAITPGGAGLVAAHTAFKDNLEIPVYPADTWTIKVSGTSGDDAAVAVLTLYDDLPGVGNAQFATWDQVQANYDGSVGMKWGPTAGGTIGAWGASRAITADDNRFQGLKYYALLGATVQTQVTALSFISNTWGGQRIGIPIGALDTDNSTWFVQLSQKHNRPLIPWFNQADAANVLGYCMDTEVSTTPVCDLNLVRLKGPLA